MNNNETKKREGFKNTLKNILAYSSAILGGFTLFFGFLSFTRLDYLTDLQKIYLISGDKVGASLYIAGLLFTYLIAYYLLILGLRFIQKEKMREWLIWAPVVWVLGVAGILLTMPTNSVLNNPQESGVIEVKDLAFEDDVVTIYYEIEGLAFFKSMGKEAEEEIIKRFCADKGTALVLKEGDSDLRLHYTDKTTKETLIFEIPKDACSIKTSNSSIFSKEEIEALRKGNNN